MRKNLLWILIPAGLLILWPYHNFQDYIAPGDHGRDLYAAQAVLRGELPYKDFWWVYEPLTPYYYALCTKLMGVHVTSLILGKLLMRLLAAGFLFAGLRHLISAPAAFFAGLWLIIFQQDFFFTYNHMAGIAINMAVLYYLCRYLAAGSSRLAWTALFWAFILGLIKVNFGIVALGVSALTVFTRSRLNRQAFSSAEKSFHVTAFLGLPLLLVLIYAALLNGLSLMEIRQCLPYWSDDQPYNTSAWAALKLFLDTTFANIRSNWMNVSFALLIWASVARCAWLLWRKAVPAQEAKRFLLLTALLMLFYLVNFHEFLKSGVWYRGFWAQPFTIALIFTLIDFATRHSHGFWRKCAFGLSIFIALSAWIDASQHLKSQKNPRQAFNVDGQTVYLTNQPQWIATVEQTTRFLKENLNKDELFFALPYDCLYYYLTGKKSPTRQLIFFEHIKVPPEQERSVIAELEKNKVNYVLMSSRAFVHVEKDLGILGQTYCPLIASYINEHFAPIARFGDWANEPGWAWNHGTLILKRK